MPWLNLKIKRFSFILPYLFLPSTPSRQCNGLPLLSKDKRKPLRRDRTCNAFWIIHLPFWPFTRKKAHFTIYYWDTSGSPIKIFLPFLSLSIWMKQPSLSDKFVWNQPEGLVATISAIHRMEHYPGDEY